MCVDSFCILSRINDISYILESEADLLETPSDATLHVPIQQRQRGFQDVCWTFLGALRQGLTEIYFDIRNFVSQNVFVGARAFNFRGGELRVRGGVAALLLDFFEEFVREVDVVGEFLGVGGGGGAIRC